MTQPPSAESPGTPPAHLEALALARREGTVLSARSARWFVLAGVAFVALAAYAGFAVAMYAFVALGVLVLFAVFNSGRPVLRKTDEAQEVSAVAGIIECDILQRVADQAAPGMRVRDRSPLQASDVQSSRVIRHRVDYISGQRSLSGVLDGDVPFCAGAIEAGQVEVIRQRQKLPVKHYETVFKGIFLVLHHPGTSGWLTLEPKQAFGTRDIVGAVLQLEDEDALHLHHADLDRLFSLRGSSADDAERLLTPALIAGLIAFRLAHGDILPSIGFKGDVISIAIPMRDDCLRLRDNPETWTDELQRFANVARAMADLLRAVHPSRPARLLEVAR